MDQCTECNKDISEETPYCEECMDKIVREAELEAQQLLELEAGMGRAIQCSYDAWQEALDILNDDQQCDDRYQTAYWHEEAQTREWAFMQEVVDCFGVNQLDADQRRRWKARQQFQQQARLKELKDEANNVSGEQLGDIMVLLNIFQEASQVSGGNHG